MTQQNSLDYWMKRLKKFNIPFKQAQERFEEAFIYFEDNDGLGIELVANKDERKGFTYGNIPLEYSLKGFYGVSLSEEGYERTAALLTDKMDYKLIGENGNRFRFSASGKAGDFVDVLCDPDSMRALQGSGSVHHVAFATANDDTQMEVREKLLKHGLNVTPMIDRQYFHSIYFREPGGILFEVATTDIGFTLDESKEHLGENLKLPPWEEKNRELIEQGLTPVRLDIEKFSD
jgi:glyoxalase family protein